MKRPRRFPAGAFVNLALALLSPRRDAFKPRAGPQLFLHGGPDAFTFSEGDSAKDHPAFAHAHEAV